MIRRWSGCEGVEEELIGASYSVGRVVATFIVFVGDLQSVQLLGIRILPEAIVVRPDVERLSLWAVQP